MLLDGCQIKPFRNVEVRANKNLETAAEREQEHPRALKRS